jgi:hypothetical protein
VNNYFNLGKSWSYIVFLSMDFGHLSKKND